MILHSSQVCNLLLAPILQLTREVWDCCCFYYIKHIRTKLLSPLLLSPLHAFDKDRGPIKQDPIGLFHSSVSIRLREVFHHAAQRYHTRLVKADLMPSNAANPTVTLCHLLPSKTYINAVLDKQFAPVYNKDFHNTVDSLIYNNALPIALPPPPPPPSRFHHQVTFNF